MPRQVSRAAYLDFLHFYLTLTISLKGLICNDFKIVVDVESLIQLELNQGF